MTKNVKIISVVLAFLLVIGGGTVFIAKLLGNRDKAVVGDEQTVVEQPDDHSPGQENDDDSEPSSDETEKEPEEDTDVDPPEEDEELEEDEDLELADNTPEEETVEETPTKPKQPKQPKQPKPDPGTPKPGDPSDPKDPVDPDPKDPTDPEDPKDPDPEPPEDERQWILVWSDEFDGTGTNLNANGIDLDKWGFQEGTGSQYGLVDWGNNEQQYYRKENARVEDGKLIIEAKKEVYGNKQYTSSRLFTGDTFAKKYGRFEARIKLPEGQGFWPAFWMMPKDSIYGGWAASGEIDIMEARGRIPGEASGAIHYGGQWPNNTYTGGTYRFPEGQNITDFHEYAIEWEPGEIRWYIDGNLYNVENNWYSHDQNQGAKYSFPAPFDQEFYLILNLAIGGNFDGGRIPNDDMLPARMEVDYVRVYESNKPYKEAKEPIIEKEELPPDAKLALEDGNWVYDNQYTRPFNIIDKNGMEFDALYWNFLTLPDFGGQGTISTEEIDGTNFARVNITRPGNQTYSVQLIQNVTVGKGRTYKVSFDAKSTDARNINVKVCAGEERGWVTYSRDESKALTSQIKSYEFIFEMTHDTDPRARLEFNVGLNNRPVWIGNVRVEEVEALFDEDGPKKPLPSGNHIYNGTFDQGYIHRMTFWSLVTDGAEAKASVDESTRELEVSITNPGTKPDAIKVVQRGMDLRKGSDYEITFKARADESRPIYVEVTNRDGNISYSGRQRIDLTTSMKEHTLTFKVEEESVLDGVFTFLLGGNIANVFIDDVTMIRTGGETDYSGVTIFPLENGDFTDGLDFWTPYVIEGGAGNISVENGEAKIAITGVGGASHTIMLVQENMPFSADIEYVLSFDARSTKDRNIEAILDTSSYQRRVNEKVSLTSEMKKYEFTFKLTADEILSLKFLMGNIDGSNTLGGHDIFIDNVVLEVKDAPFKRPPRLYADKTENVVGNDIEITFKDVKEWRNAVKAVKLNDQTLSQDKYNLEAGKLVLLAENFTKADSYTILVEADGYAEARVIQHVSSGDGNLVRNGDFSNGANNWNIWSGEGGFGTLNVVDGAANIEISSIGSQNWHVQFYQEGIELKAGKTYELSFKARSTVERPIRIEYSNFHGNPDVYFVLKETDDTYTAQFKAPEDKALKLNFCIANVAYDDVVTPSVPHTITIDDVKLVEVEEGSEPDPSDPDKKWKEIGENLIENGTFDEDLSHWKIHNQGDYEPWAGLADFVVEDGKVKATVRQVGWEWWHIQLYQEPVNVPAGTYKISFDMSSDKQRSAYVELTDSGTPIQTFTVTSDMKTYEAIIEVNSAGNYKFMFGLGRASGDVELGVPYNIYIDNVRLVEVEEEE